MGDKKPVAEVVTSIRGAATTNGIAGNAEGVDDVTEGADVQAVRVDVNRPPVRLPSIVLATLGVLAVLVFAYLVYQLLPILLLIFVSVLFATAIEPVVNWLRRGPFNRSAGILIAYTGLFLLIGVIGFVTVPVFLNQVGELSTTLPNKLNDLEKGVRTMHEGFVKTQVLNFVDAGQYAVSQLTRPAALNSDPEKVAVATQTTLSVAEVFFAITTLFVVAYYWLAERTLIKRAVMSWLTPRRANRVRRVWDDIEVKVGGWVRGQLTLMVIVGLASAVGYLILGIRYWPALALFIGIAEAIPLVGPYIGTAPAVLVALTQDGNDGLPSMLGMGDFGSLTRALLVVAFAVLLQSVEGNVLVPRVMKNSVGISPLTVLVSLLIGGSLAGLIGALLAVPIAGSIQVILQDIKAAHESDEKLEAITAGVEETRREAGELVVAHPSPAGTTSGTEVQGQAGSNA